MSLASYHCSTALNLWVKDRSGSIILSLRRENITVLPVRLIALISGLVTHSIDPLKVSIIWLPQCHCALGYLAVLMTGMSILRCLDTIQWFCDPRSHFHFLLTFLIYLKFDLVYHHFKNISKCFLVGKARFELASSPHPKCGGVTYSPTFRYWFTPEPCPFPNTII